MRDIYRVYGAAARNAHKECLVCSMEVCMMANCVPCQQLFSWKTHTLQSMAMCVQTVDDVFTLVDVSHFYPLSCRGLDQPAIHLGYW